MPNAKRVYGVMKVHGLLLQCHTDAIDTRRHDGRVAVEQSNLSRCSDCDNREKVRVAFALDCCADPDPLSQVHAANIYVSLLCASTVPKQGSPARPQPNAGLAPAAPCRPPS
jgi:hypothetical protein